MRGDDDVDDCRSSSLSDIDERIDYDQARGEPVLSRRAPPSEVDSEAETERLEPTPQKFRKHVSIITAGTSAVRLFGTSTRQQAAKKEASAEVEAVAVAVGARPPSTRRRGEAAPPTNNSATAMDTPAPTPAAAPVAASIPAADIRHSPSPRTAHKLPSPPEVAGQKRKRQDGGAAAAAAAGSEKNGDADPDEADEPLRKRTNVPRGDGVVPAPVTVNNPPETNGQAATPHEDVPMPDAVVAGGTEGGSVAGPVKTERTASPSVSRSNRKGRRRTTRHASHGLREAEEAEAVEEEAAGTRPPNADGGGNTGEPDEPVEAEEEEDAEAAIIKSEENIKRNEALESLAAIEEQFVVFREKLYDERLSQLTNELALLSQPNSTHPEYLAKVQCINARRDEKIFLERILFQFKLQALRTKYAAERSQILSQYYQTVRGHRDEALDEAGEQWCEVHRGRRQWRGGNLQDYAYMFPTRRSQHAARQTAYNMEVSILSGIAKYVGFPAAPDIKGVRSTDMDADIQAMGL